MLTEAVSTVVVVDEEGEEVHRELRRFS